ncbi:MBL fold metallo-hydrolase [Umezawaea sp. Da 62-37]|uniref:MBL fold metallo-hydrolase n=1 Tax=Umezawaea sp. Da 62-37 TaxID=3075927 RepID=UPI0028F70473|nr:MBL fold metallo-hydrolase [Umezawaea sp. Da 62-37]WNV90818.1 MBL fold metallo-hydrolase [Umezawaea sp. Da 62-37]
MATKSSANGADPEPGGESFVQLADGVHALTSEGDPNVGAVEAEDFLVCFEARSTPAAARRWLLRLRERTAKPVRYLVLSHFHAVRTLGASAFDADVVIAHERTRTLIAERGRQDWAGELARTPEAFPEAAGIPGLTWPTMTFSDRLTIPLGGERGDLELRHPGRGHTAGDIVGWLPQQRILFAGDLVESRAAPHCGDAFHDEWATSTLDKVAALGAELLVGGCGPVARNRAEVDAAIAQSRHFLDELRRAVTDVRDRSGTPAEAYRAAHDALAPRFHGRPSFDNLPLAVRRYWDECDGVTWPRIWTPQRESEVRTALT